mmetsp:Transcript_12640/g.37259  ORF Transcript_12640/g.37259 Transcript_12640/m.37259 type:complete len:166 (-) Transcript_12640:438-935(-)
MGGRICPSSDAVSMAAALRAILIRSIVKRLAAARSFSNCVTLRFSRKSSFSVRRRSRRAAIELLVAVLDVIVVVAFGEDGKFGEVNGGKKPPPPKAGDDSGDALEADETKGGDEEGNRGESCWLAKVDEEDAGTSATVSGDAIRGGVIASLNFPSTVASSLRFAS